MAQSGRDDYIREISELRAKVDDLERGLATYDAIYKRIREALPVAASGRDESVKRAVERAMTDAYIQWKADEGA